MQTADRPTLPDSDRRIVLLAGGGHGIGRATAHDIVRRGHVLAACDKDMNALEALRRELPADAVFLEGTDVTSPEAVDAFVGRVHDRFGRIDALVSNAGGMISLVSEGTVDANIRGFMDIPRSDWRAIIHLNLIGSMNLAHAVLPHMIERETGRIVLVSSVSGLVGGRGLSVYAAAKGGVIAFAKSLAREYSARGISINSVAPGGVATRAFPPDSPSTSERAKRVAAGRLAEPAEIANVLSYLALDAPTYLTGEVISVSGGPP